MKFFILTDKIANPSSLQVQSISNLVPYIMYLGFVFNWPKEIKNMLFLSK